MALTVVQSAGPVQVQSLTGPLTATLPGATGTGNTLVACITTSGATTRPGVSSLKLGGSADNWQAAYTDTSGSAGAGIIWYDPGCASGQTSVVLTCSGGAGINADIYLTVYEVTGILAFDQGSSGHAASGATTWSSGTTAATGTASEIFFGTAMGTTSIPAVTGAGTWTTVQSGAGQFDQVAGYRIVSATGTATFSGTQTSGGYIAVVATFSGSVTLAGTAGLAGTGTLGGAGVFAGGPAVFSGTGTLGGAGIASGFGGSANLSGTGTLGGAGTGIYAQSAALSGAGTLNATWIGLLQQPPVTLSGLGTLNLAGIMLGTGAGLSGNGTLSVLQATGGLVFASPGAATPQAYPVSSTVMVAPPGSGSWVPLGTLGTVTALTYSFTCPGGCDAMTATVMVPASYRNQLLNPGWPVRITRGGHQVWDGKLDEAVPTSAGWNLTAVGTGNRGTDFLAIYSGAWPAGQPDASISGAVSRGLPWASAGIGTPPGAWYGQAVDSGAQTITALLNLLCTRGGLTWYVNSQPGGLPGDDLTVFPLPTVVNRLLTCTEPATRTLGGDINTIWLRYQSGADTSAGGGTTATYGTTSVQNAASVAAHGVLETFIDISDVGVMTAAAAQAAGSAVLQIYQRASFAGPFTGHYGQLMNAGGAPVDPGTDQAGTVCKLILTDFGYGGEITPQFPLTFITGQYKWDDLAQTFTITPYVTADQSLTGLLSTAHTLLAPITAAGG